MMWEKLFVAAPALSFGVVLQTARAFACAVCLTGADDAITGGYNASVLFLMATPYVVGSCIAAGLVIAYRRALKRRQNAEEEESAPPGWKQEESSR